MGVWDPDGDSVISQGSGATIRISRAFGFGIERFRVWILSAWAWMLKAFLALGFSVLSQGSGV